MSGASVKEIADVMKMSEKSVENAIRRARDKIRKAF
jgi:DNA-directed RNA polymerase specialized sigma24 family protein